VERFVDNLLKSRNELNNTTIRTIFSKGILEEYVDVLNLMASGDVSQRSFEDIIELCRKYVRNKEKIGKGVRATKSTGSLTRIELGNLLQIFEADILETMSAQIDSINIKTKFEDESLSILCSCCKKKHRVIKFPIK
jgi:hypothetical protein